MANYSRKSLWVVMVLVLTTSVVQAQWQQVAQNIVPPPSQHVGALRAQGSVAWAGTTSLAFSTDSGRTWQPNTSWPSFSSIPDIAIYDSLTVLVGTNGDGLYLTTNGGQNWAQLFPDAISQPPFNQVAFNGSASSLVAVSYNTSTLYVSSDRGVTWSQSQTTFSGSTAALCFAIARDKTIYVESYIGGSGWVNASQDGGTTWGVDGGAVDGDSNTLSADSCDAQRLYLVNENTVARTNNITCIELSTDGGASWRATNSRALDYYSGSMASTANVLYVGTVPNGGDGVLRSTDRGITWKNIGGPTEDFDTRTIAAIDNNTVLVMDSSGNIWRTNNSGGDSLTLPSSINTALLLPNEPAQIEQFSCSTPVDTSIALALTGCGSPTGVLDSAWITGSPTFQISDTRAAPRSLAMLDSILVSYLSDQSADSAELHLRFDLGFGARDTTVLLIGHSASPLLSKPALLHREAASAFLGQIDSLPLAVDVSSDINIDSLWPFLTGIEATYSWDSSIVRSVAYFPPNGWSLNSLQAHANSEDVSIFKISAAASNPLELGIALFQPVANELATTWVSLPRFVLNMGNSSVSLCVTQNEDSHWSVKDLGASGVGLVPSSNENLTLYPNPANGNVWISSSADLGTVTIQVYDMLGIEHSRAQVNMMKSESMELSLPPADGIYTVVVHFALGTFNLRVIRRY